MQMGLQVSWSVWGCKTVNNTFKSPVTGANRVDTDSNSRGVNYKHVILWSQMQGVTMRRKWQQIKLSNMECSVWGGGKCSRMLVRVMEMAMWSRIICLPFLIMYLSLCPIDCGHWMLSLNQFFQEEKWFVYEQFLPLLSMTAPPAVLKWIRMKPETTGVYRAGNLFSVCSHHIRQTCMFSNRTQCHTHVGLQAQYSPTVTYSSYPFQEWK